MTTLLLTENFPPRTGGSGRWFWEIYSRLPRAEYLIAAAEHPAAAGFDDTHDRRIVRLPLSMSQWGVRSFTALRGYAKAVSRLRKLVRAENVHRIHCGRCLPEGFMAWVLRWLTGVRYAVYAHGEDVTTAATSRELSWMVRRVFGAADFVIANSRSTERILLEEWRLPPGRVRLLHPGVDTSRFVPAPRSVTVRERLGWGARPVVLTVGRLQKRKGHDMMIRALGAIRRVVPDVLYAIVGAGEERAALETLVAGEGVVGHVQFLGEIDDARLVECYQQCDLFALPNRLVGRDLEGFGMVLLEAQACGRPVLAGNSGGTAETMRLPETGRVVSCDGPCELAAAVADLLTEPGLLDRMGEAGRRWVVESFDWGVLTQRAQAIFAGDRGMSTPAGAVVGAAS